MNDPSFDGKFKIYRNWFALAIATVGVFAISIAFIAWFNDGLKSNEIGDAMGGIIGPFIGIIGAALTFLAFWIQFKANEQQRGDIRTERFETQFFEMLGIHKSNVEELRFSYQIENAKSSKGVKHTDERRKVFRAIYSQYKSIYLEMGAVFPEAVTDLYQEQYLNQLRANRVLKSRGLDHLELAKVDLAYLMVFYGLSEEGQLTICAITENHYQSQAIKRILRFSATKPKRFSPRWTTWQKFNLASSSEKPNWWEHIVQEHISRERTPFPNTWTSEERVTAQSFRYDNTHEKFYGGHQHRLAHYFRHLFKTYEYIDQASGLKYYQRYRYAAIVRAQLSNYEQIIFCINSLSLLGRGREFAERKASNTAIREGAHLVSKYNIIKNIPGQRMIPGIDLAKVYPVIDFETFQLANGAERDEFIKTFWDVPDRQTDVNRGR